MSNPSSTRPFASWTSGWCATAARDEGLPLFPATLAGSFPSLRGSPEPEKLWAPWKLEGDALKEGQRDASGSPRHAGRGGLDVVSDGEQTRKHFVNGYMEKLEGHRLRESQDVRIRNRYDANVPRVVGP
jgi:5-methyltetrahydropteroyltriglutamate--homocysteine methyltransferase